MAVKDIGQHPAGYDRAVPAFFEVAAGLVALLLLPVGAFCLIRGRLPKGYGVLGRLVRSSSAIRRLGAILTVGSATYLILLYRSLRTFG